MRYDRSFQEYEIYSIFGNQKIETCDYENH